MNINNVDNPTVGSNENVLSDIFGLEIHSTLKVTCTCISGTY